MANETIQKLIGDSFEKLSSEKIVNDVYKRNTLKELHTRITSSDYAQLQEQKLTYLLEHVIKSLIVFLSDKSEKCRELSAIILKYLLQHSLISKNNVPSLLNILARRLGKIDERERSEEIRLLEIELLGEIIENNMCLCLNDISSSLTACIVDDCPEVKRKSCECLLLMASKQNSNFHMIASNFLKPLLCSITHQHSKTRILCIKAIGVVADFLNEKEFDEALIHLAQRLFDHSSSVRMTVAEVIGNMLINLKDRYSYFHRLIPLMLSLLYDEVPEISSKAEDIWLKVGNHYIIENENTYKDLIDFSHPDPGGRPPLGCRILVQRHIFNILPPLLKDIVDWKLETRIKSSKTLYSLILHSEDKITMKLPEVLEGIMNAVKIEGKQTIDIVMDCAELLGYFVDPSHLIDSILSLMHKNPSSVHLNILASALKGMKNTVPVECFVAIIKFLTDPEICRTRKADDQANLLLCIETLLSTSCEIDSDVSYFTFIILTSVSGLAASEVIILKANELLQHLAELQSCTKTILFEQHTASFLKVLSESNEVWTEMSPEMSIFKFLIESGHLDEEMMNIIIPILTNNLHHSKNAKLRYMVMKISTSLFEKMSAIFYKSFSEQILSLLHLGIFPNLTWSAGRTASSLRAIAAATLYQILYKSSIKKQMLTSISDELLPLIATLSEDEEVTTRLIACKILNIILPELTDSTDEIKIHTLCHQMLHCLDDESDNIRLMIIKVLESYIKSFPQDYNWSLYQSHLKHLFENVLLHMDDRNEKIKQHIFDLLKNIAYIAPDILLQEVESKRYVMLACDLCDSLTEHIRSIKL
ncbi:dynein assembly factor 5, axonemal [Caerostris darwini]|uniref:Dynein assembly factor 5, axonemal n=1 Tax=Caerostris darwini TaxID=1538125 RepID=A0AAV4RRL8_9ARAC|nr:dynein assembly factor 5, axonemal [Caerostris darwini]